MSSTSDSICQGAATLCTEIPFGHRSATLVVHKNGDSFKPQGGTLLVSGKVRRCDHLESVASIEGFLDEAFEGPYVLDHAGAEWLCLSQCKVSDPLQELLPTFCLYPSKQDDILPPLA